MKQWVFRSSCLRAERLRHNLFAVCEAAGKAAVSLRLLFSAVQAEDIIISYLLPAVNTKLAHKLAP